MGSVVIVGAGAMGLWLAARLAAAGSHELTLIARSWELDALGRQGIVLRSVVPGEPVDLPIAMSNDFRVIGDHDAATADWSPIGAAFVAVRSYQTQEAAALVASLPTTVDTIVTLQNGLGNAERLADMFGPSHVVAGTTTHGVTKEKIGRALHAGAGDTFVGPWAPADGGAERAACVRSWLREAGITTDLVGDPRPAIWRKVVVNAAINPATAIHRVLNGALLDDGPLHQLLVDAASEAAAVARAEGIDVSDDEAVEAAQRVARRTAANRSSMLQARDSGKRLETDAITGEVVKRAALHGIAVPVNDRLLAALRALEG